MPAAHPMSIRTVSEQVYTLVRYIQLAWYAGAETRFLTRHNEPRSSEGCYRAARFFRRVLMVDVRLVIFLAERQSPLDPR
jgi:hypothetical protein